MFNKDVLKKENREEVLRLLNLKEDFDKFENKYKLMPVDWGGDRKTAKLEVWKGAEKYISLASIWRTKKEGAAYFVLQWTFSHTDTRDGLINLEGLKFLLDGEVQDISVGTRTEFDSSKIAFIDEDKLVKFFSAKSLEIRVSANIANADYDEKSCKKFQTYLKESYEAIKDLEDYDIIKEAEKLNPPPATPPKAEEKKKSGFGKWLIISVIVFGIIGAIADKSDKSKTTKTTGSAPADVNQGVKPADNQEPPKIDSATEVEKK